MPRGKDIHESDVERASQDYFEQTGDEDAQGELFSEELSRIADALATQQGADKFEIKLALTLKPVGDNTMPDTIGIIKGKFGKDYVEEVIQMLVHSEKFKKRLRSIVGDPSGKLKQDLEEAREAAN